MVDDLNETPSMKFVFQLWMILEYVLGDWLGQEFLSLSCAVNTLSTRLVAETAMNWITHLLLPTSKIYSTRVIQGEYPC